MSIDAKAWAAIIAGYMPADTTEPASGAGPNYYGFISANGAWYILKETISGEDGAYRFVKGQSGYETAWAARASLTGYALFNGFY